MFTVVLDTCALYPSYLRDTLLRLAERRLYRAMWSADILGELHRVLVSQAHLAPAGVDHLLNQMHAAFAESEIYDYEPLVEQLACPDPDDRHVLAAAIRAHAATIVTFNVRDFPLDVTAPFDVEAVHPDDFLLDQLDLAPPLVLDELRRQAATYKREPRTIHGLLDALERSGTPDFADEVRRLLD